MSNYNKSKVRFDRKDLKQPDQFQVAGGDILKKSAAHRQLIIGLIVGVLLTGALIFGITSYKRAQVENSARLLHKGNIALNPGDFAPEQKPDLPAAIANFEQLQKEYPSTAAAHFASYYLGVASFQMGEYQTAVGHFDNYVSQELPDPTLKAMALVAKAKAQEALGEKSSALASLAEAKEISSSVYGDFAQSEIDRINGVMPAAKTASDDADLQKKLQALMAEMKEKQQQEGEQGDQ